MDWWHGHWLVMLIALVGYGESIACTKNFCDMVRCAQKTPEDCASLKPPEEYRPRDTTVCRCCNSCKKYAEEGEECDIIRRPVIIRGGLPQEAAHCRPGLLCNSSNRCQRFNCYFI